ncbi:ECF-type sigma factor [Alienimonas californiensis]|uniref:ECF sigma factor n=1 Tax=Alienimonas californiensis TaxID=2527989 RepID=A0A517P6C1_9PLAN|nr:ECF-type sigma factor [Alienimonas californiensis]QDT14938.1 ECF sigma factor [Alienimonas californiensis]
MSDVTHLLDRCESGDPAAADALLPLVYDELRRLARSRMRHEGSDLTLQATGLVHEAYLRLTQSSGDEQASGDDPPGDDPPGGARGWDSRGHFFAAAAEAMRRILIERARRKARLKHGGGRRRASLSAVQRAGRGPAVDPPGFAEDGGGGELLALDAALTRFETERPRAAAVVKLRYFAGLSFEETAAALNISRATAVRDWTLGRAWLHREIAGIGARGDFP